MMRLKDKTSLCDYFIVMSAPSTVRVKTIADFIEESLGENRHRLRHKEGYREARWVLLDFGDVIVHVFRDPARKYYSIENLWGDAPSRVFVK